MSALPRALEAIQRGDLRQLRELLADDPSLVEARTEQGVSLILWAAYHRRLDAAAALAAKRETLDIFEAAALGRADHVAACCRQQAKAVDAYSPDGFQPLHLAAFFGHVHAADVLLARGANVNAAARNPSRVRPLHSAVAGRSAAVVRRLIEHGADINATQHGGWTPLQAAALHGDRELVQFFLDHGADAALRSDDGKTAADLAESAGHANVAAMLRRAD
jgi:ankyrin repeat protein